ncbi:prevent-host-death protein [Arthrobacter sp. 24S4-2]|uniref:prevent-host-death protein n=1 Tax=Arthrobacter sp. 24S4-2 TaxID=2575374 RepID=UPI0020C793BC|nr:prevent-host-death protein [Arthrobacter sp. 24S4-2]
MSAATKSRKTPQPSKTPVAFQPFKTRTSFQSSELSRSSADVFAAAADHPVRVTRRDGESLVLMSESADAARISLLELAAQLVAVSTSTEGTLAARMSDRFPWMLALSPADQEACADDVLAAARASFATNQPHLAIAELTSWRETATAIAAGLGKEPVEWLDDSEAVERP